MIRVFLSHRSAKSCAVQQKRAHRSTYYAYRKPPHLDRESLRAVAAAGTGLRRAEGSRRSLARRYRDSPFANRIPLRGGASARSVLVADFRPETGEICTAQGGLIGPSPEPEAQMGFRASIAISDLD